jgi:putative ABC transport system ATP-binding protein
MELIRLSGINLKLNERENTRSEKKQRNRTIFENYNLTVNEGDKIQISGRSGSGKSTLLKILLGFVRPDSGNVFIKGRKITDKDFRHVRTLFAYVNQDVTLRPGPVRQILKDISSFSGNKYDGQIDEKLARFFDMEPALFDKDTEKLSGGERQRLGLMIAVELDRPVFLLDEVTSALDAELKQKTADYFAAAGKTVIVVSHDPEWRRSGKFKQEIL